MSSAFVSYAHEDQEFVLALVELLQGQGVEITYDQIVLEVGDSLIHRISAAIVEGDFLIAVVSPSSVRSGWCQKELAIAETQGINEKRVKVLPVRFRGAEMPAMLLDTVWADADSEDLGTVARRLARAMTTHPDGRAELATPHGAEGVHAHAERPGDSGVAAVDLVTDGVLAVLDAWEGVWNRHGNLADIQPFQRRLRFDFDKLPEHVRLALPLVGRLADANWREDEMFATHDSFLDAERDLEEELRAVRAQVAQGLPVSPRWLIDADLGLVPVTRDAVAHLWGLARGDETARVMVLISGTALASSNEGLPREVVSAKETNGRSVVVSLLSLEEPPAEVMVSTAGIQWPVVG